MLQVVAKETEFQEVMLPHECLMTWHNREAKGLPNELEGHRLYWYIQKIGIYSRIAYLVNASELNKKLRTAHKDDKTVPAYQKG